MRRTTGISLQNRPSRITLRVQGWWRGWQKYLDPETWKDVFTPLLGLFLRVWRGSDLLRCEWPVHEMRLGLLKCRSLNELDVRICVDFSTLKDEKWGETSMCLERWPKPWRKRAFDVGKPVTRNQECPLFMLKECDHFVGYKSPQLM